MPSDNFIQFLGVSFPRFFAQLISLVLNLCFSGHLNTEIIQELKQAFGIFLGLTNVDQQSLDQCRHVLQIANHIFQRLHLETQHRDRIIEHQFRPQQPFQLLCDLEAARH